MLVILIASNTVLFAIQQIIHIYYMNGILFQYFSYQPNIYKCLVHPWSFISYSFLHSDKNHLYSNMLILIIYFEVLKNVNNRVLWKVYIVSVVFSVLIATFLGIIYSSFFTYIETKYYMIGASAGVSGLISFAMFNFGDKKLDLFIIKTKVKYLTSFLIITFIVHITFHSSVISNIAHMGGFFTAWYLNITNRDKFTLKI